MPCEQLAENFKSYFRIVYANTDVLLKQVYKIRYDVFCEELRLEENCPQDVEKDECDAYSYHFLLQHVHTSAYAGTVRFVLPPASRPDLLMPIEKYCSHAIDREIVDPSQLRRGTFGEVSRLAVPARFRKRAGESGVSHTVESPANSAGNKEKRLFPYISVGLYLASAACGILHNLDCSFVMIEPRLAIALRRVGIRFQKVGDVIDYHGLRAPHYIDREMLLNHLKPEVAGLFEHIREEISEQFPPLNDTRQLAV